MMTAPLDLDRNGEEVGAGAAVQSGVGLNRVAVKFRSTGAQEETGAGAGAAKEGAILLLLAEILLLRLMLLLLLPPQ